MEAVKRIKLMVENSDEIDMNPLLEYQNAMSSTSTTALSSQLDALKFISICVIYRNSMLISMFHMECPFDSTQIQCALLRAKESQSNS